MQSNANLKDSAIWIRGLYTILFGIIYYFLFFLVLLIAIFQFLLRLFTSQCNDELLSFSDSLGEYVSQVLKYITFKSDVRPYPFSPWPNNNKPEPQAEVIRTTSMKKKRARKKTTRKTDSSGT